MIDWHQVAELKGAIGKDDFEEVVVLFLQEVEVALDRLCTTSGEALCAELHNLKGSALNLGFRNLAVLCQTEEEAAKSNQTVNVAQLHSSFEASRQVFEQGQAQPPQIGIPNS